MTQTIIVIDEAVNWRGQQSFETLEEFLKTLSNEALESELARRDRQFNEAIA